MCKVYIKGWFKLLFVFIVGFYVLHAANMQDSQCFFPALNPYYKEANRKIFEACDSFEEKDEIKCKQAKEQYKDEWSILLSSLVDDVSVKLIDNDKIVDDKISFKYILEEYANYYEVEYNDEYEITNISSIYPSFGEKEIRQAAQCNGKKCNVLGYDNYGELVFEANCVNGINHGFQKLYDMELNFNNGKLEGMQKFPTFYHEEKKINEVIVKNGKISGNITYFIGHGFRDREVNITFKNGKAVGKANESGRKSAGVIHDYEYDFDENGNIKKITEGNGSTKTRSKGDKIEDEENFDGNIQTITELTYTNNKLLYKHQTFKVPKGFNVHVRYDPSIKNFEETLEELEKYHNKKIEYNKNKQLKYKYITKQFNEKGQKDGLWIDKTIIIDGDMTVSFPDKDSNNQMDEYDRDYKNIKYETTIESNYVKGNLNGAKIKTENGRKVSEEIYENGVLNGTLKEWDDYGNLIKAEIYKNGKRVQIIR